MTASPDSSPPGASVRWLRRPGPDAVADYSVITWPELVGGWIDPVRNVGMERDSLENAAHLWLAELGRHPRLAVINVVLDDAWAAADLLGYVVEPAIRRGIELVIGADREFPQHDDEAFFEEHYGYNYSLERLRWQIFGHPSPVERPPSLPDTGFVPAPGAQSEAVHAGGGVVQIIAPAGSGKTSVLIERVRELRRRGAPAQSIICLTFNRAARIELDERLGAAGVGAVAARTFHGLARQILVKAREIPQDQAFGGPTLSQWRRICSIARRETELWIDPEEAQTRLSDIKLALLLTAEQYAARVAGSDDQTALTMAAIYTAYQETQKAAGRVDFDDLVLRATLLLRNDADVRGQWQGCYHHVLVDEYQDIEPAQELIVRLIAAPQDQLFCVGDEDQTLYAFRRASVERIICLDGPYPGLQRVFLDVNYRCPPKIVAASKTLIDVNRVRFPKPIKPNPARTDQGVITLKPADRKLEAADGIAALLATKRRGEITVLARTTNALRPVALACADRGVPIDGNDKLFKATAARRALQDHIRLAIEPHKATDKLVASVCQTPARQLNRGAEQIVAERLRNGRSFEIAFAGVPAPRRGQGMLLAPDDLFTRLAACRDAAGMVTLLREGGGLDDWFAQSDQLAGLDQFESEVLEQAEHDAAGRSPSSYLADLDRQAQALEAVRDEINGIELLTIHGSKGRQWPHVILLACDEGMLPHAQSLAVDVEQLERGEGPEGERRLAYVGFTRAQEHLEIHHDPKTPSPFLAEAGLLMRPAPPARIVVDEPIRNLVKRFFGL